jgi:hypothetical protein
MIRPATETRGTGPGTRRAGLLLGLALLWCLLLVVHPLLHATGPDTHCLLCAALQAVAIVVAALALRAPVQTSRRASLALCPAARYASLVCDSRGPPSR